MKLVNLSEQILFDLFDYLSIIEIFRSFASLNQHFNKHIFTYLKTKIDFNLQSVSTYDLLAMCRLYLPENIDEFISLCFSNTYKNPLQIDLSSNLQSMTFQYIFLHTDMTVIINQLKFYPNLINLNLIDCNFDFHNNSINQIWNLSKLKQFHMNTSRYRQHVSLNLSIHSSTIQLISIEKIYFNRKSLNDLFYFTPYLQRLLIYTERDDKYFDIDHLPYLNKFEIIENDAPSYTNRLYKEDRLINLLQTMPNLYSLSVTISDMILDGYQWEYLITNYLPKLQIFQCRMEKLFVRLQKINTVVDHLIQSFQTKFWIETHKWFIRCHSNVKDSYHNRILYYTIPNIFRKLTIVNDNQWYRSNNKNDCSLSDQFIIIQKPISRFKRIKKLFKSAPCLVDTSSISCLTTVYELTIDRAFNIYLSTFIGKLVQLNSLHLLFYNIHNNINEFQVQILLDHAPNLSTLSIIYYINIFSKFILNNLKSKSIYQLNLRKMNYSYASIGYDMNKCIDLTSSYLGKQCEILTIRVTNKYCIAYLIKNMVNLRLLKVYCQDYQYQRFLKANETERSLLSFDYDRLIQWLHIHLPSSVTIERYRYPIDTIHIWVHH